MPLTMLLSHVSSSLRICCRVLALAGVYGCQAYSSPQVTSNSPLEIQSFSRQSADSSAEVSLTVLNKADKDVVALTLATTYFDAENKAVGRLATNQIFGLEPKATRKTLAPGERWATQKGLPLPVSQNGSPARYEIVVDYVLFKDGSTWGPDQMKQSLHIAGIQKGWALARSTLRSVLAKQGEQAVVEILNQNVPDKQ